SGYSAPSETSAAALRGGRRFSLGLRAEVWICFVCANRKARTGRMSCLGGQRHHAGRLWAQTSNRAIRYDKRHYKRRNRIEMMFGGLKDCRGVATCSSEYELSLGCLRSQGLFR